MNVLTVAFVVFTVIMFLAFIDIPGGPFRLLAAVVLRAIAFGMLQFALHVFNPFAAVLDRWRYTRRTAGRLRRYGLLFIRFVVVPMAHLVAALNNAD